MKIINNSHTKNKKSNTQSKTSNIQSKISNTENKNPNTQSKIYGDTTKNIFSASKKLFQTKKKTEKNTEKKPSENISNTTQDKIEENKTETQGSENFAVVQNNKNIEDLKTKKDEIMKEKVALFKQKAAEKKEALNEIPNLSKELINDNLSDIEKAQDVFVITQEQIIQEENIFTIQALSKGLPSGILKDGLTYQMIFDAIGTIKNKEVKTTIENYLLTGQILQAQEYLGMKVNSVYQDNKADGKLDQRTLNRMVSPLFHLSGEKFLNEKSIPDDVKEAYKKFENKEGLFNNFGLPYAIVSKDPTDYNLYLFDTENRLISRHKVLLGKTKGDKPNVAYNNISFTTPAGMYSVNVREFNTKEYAGPGEYVSLLPLEGQYDKDNTYAYTMGFHCYFRGRESFFKGLDKRRQSFGCINLIPEGAPFDNLEWKTLANDQTKGIGSKFYVTPEHQ